MKDVITKVISDGIKYDDLIVEGSEAKYEVQIVSNVFDGKSTIQRHKLIYALLAVSYTHLTLPTRLSV